MSYLEWKRAGCPTSSEPDTYPSDLWAVYATPEVVLELLDTAQQKSRPAQCACCNPSWCKTTSKCLRQQAGQADNVRRLVAPVAWWRLSTLPECGPCATTDADEAQEWRAQGLDVRTLREPTREAQNLRAALRLCHQRLEFMQMLYESDLQELRDGSVDALRDALAAGAAALQD